MGEWDLNDQLLPELLLVQLQQTEAYQDQSLGYIINVRYGHCSGNVTKLTRPLSY